jgi:hypothetical protein
VCQVVSEGGLSGFFSTPVDALLPLPQKFSP